MSRDFYTIFGVITFYSLGLAFVVAVAWKISGRMVKPRQKGKVVNLAGVKFDKKV